MKKLKLLFLSSVMVVFTACGTETTLNNSTRFDLWEYMTSPIDYKVQYRIYENGISKNHYIEYHRMLNDEYQQDSDDGITTLLLTSSYITMREPLQDVTIDRYVHLRDRDVFRGELIQSCSIERYYRDYEIKGIIFYEVIMVDCTSKSGVKQEFYYGYNEGLVAKYQDDGETQLEWIKINETRI